jgi:hypothetical protein
MCWDGEFSPKPPTIPGQHHLIEFSKSGIILTTNSTRTRVLDRRSAFRSAGRFWHGNLVVALNIL